MNNTGLDFLIRKIAHGDLSAQAELYTITSAPFTQHVTRWFGSSLSEEDIEEIVSQSILLMFLNAAGYRGGNGDSSAWGWAYTIARNQALKWLDTRKRELSFSEVSEDDLDTEAGITGQMINRLHLNPLQDGVEDQVIERMLREKVMEIIQQLDSREKLILVLHFEKEWTFKQIAAHLRLTPARITQITQGILRKCEAAAG